MHGQPGFHGIYPILYALFGADGRLDRGAMRRQVEACLSHGAHGMACLGIATEVRKLARDERLDVMRWLAEDVGGRVPFCVTVFGNSVEEQVDYVRAAEALGAAWVILQPPADTGRDEAEYLQFFGDIMASTQLPVAIQNAPEYLGVGLTPEALAVLAARHDNFRLLKGEAPAVHMRQVIEVTAGRLAVFNGRAGLELPDNLRAGCAGLIPAPDCVDRQVRIYQLMRQGDSLGEAAAESLYRETLPAIVFVMQSVDTLICYGKRLTAARLGMGTVHDRQPAMAPTDFGLTCVQRLARALGPL